MNAPEEQLRELATRGAAELYGATPAELLHWTDQHFPGSWVAASNMADAVLVDLAAKVRPGVGVIFLDTGYHFAETIGTRDQIQAIYDIELLNTTPEQSVAQQYTTHGKNLFASNPTLCCQLRKVEPLRKALRGYSAWVTGIRRVESRTRANAPLIGFDEQFKLVKVNPLAAWSDADMADYIDEHNIFVNPLVGSGYPSIGCAPCTAKPVAGADPRSGRWVGTAKTECGLHAS